MKIGNIEIKNKIVLAPMAGVTDLPYRLICKEMGAGLVVSEMISSKGIYYGDKKTEELMMTSKKETPFAVQIFGSDPDIMEAVVKEKINQRKDIDIIDINMGCPAPKIVKNGDGSALMKKPSLAREILKRVVTNSTKPVSLKIRLGWDHKNINALEIAKIAEEEGISALTIHGRTREMFYSGKANWDYIKEIKENLNIPVIGNGDIFTADDALEMLEYTKCDAIALARGIKGNPWLIKEIAHKVNGEDFKKPDLKDIIEMAIKHLNLIIHFKGEARGVKEMRKHISWYVKGLPDSNILKDEINKLEKAKDVKNRLVEYYNEKS